LPINTSFSELAVTTIAERTKSFANNVENGNALLKTLQESGKIRTADGGTQILQEIDIVENGTFMYYTGYEVLNVNPSEVLSTSQWDWKLASVVVSMSGYESEVVNAGTNRQIDLFESRYENANRTMRNKISEGIYSDGTGSAGKQITGLQYIIEDVPGSLVTVAGINDNTYTAWQNQALDFGAVTSTDIQEKMNEIYLSCTFGNESPNVIVADSIFYKMYWDSLQAIQRITEDGTGGAGFRSLRYAGGIPVYYENAAIPANHLYMLNTEFLHWRPHVDRNMVSLGERKPTNQDAMVFPIGFAGNLTCSGRRYQGVGYT